MARAMAITAATAIRITTITTPTKRIATSCAAACTRHPAGASGRSRSAADRVGQPFLAQNIKRAAHAPRFIIEFSRQPSTSSAKHLVFLHPGLHPAPCILGRFLAITRAIVGVEAMRRARIDLELGGLLVSRQRGLQ